MNTSEKASHFAVFKDDACDIMESPKQKSAVCVVDDNLEIRTSIEKLIQQTNDVEVRGFGSGIEFLQNFASEFYCVVLDLKMPEMDGWAVINQLDQINNEVPVLLFSGSYGEIQRKDDVPSFVQAIYQKPFDMMKLIDHVSQIVGELNLDAN